MSLLWTSAELVAGTNGRPLGSLPEGVTGISIDTRTLAPGDAFFAIKGETFDGHDFATAAMKAGAALLVVSEAKLPALGRINAPLIVVPEVLAALEMAGRAARDRCKAKIIAVTGSAGKTTTKDALRHVLGTVGTVHASDRSFNNHWGVPLTLARLPQDCDYGIFEIGMNHADEIRPLVGMVRPHVAIVTLIAAAHLGHFRNLDEIARAKAEIFEGVVRDGHALINRDDPKWRLLERAARDAGVQNVWGFGEHARSTFRLMKCTLGADDSMIVARMAGQELPARISAPGRHMVQNALAVLGAAYLAGAEMQPVADALGRLQVEAGRGKRHSLPLAGGSVTLIDESYNANPASVRAALQVLSSTPVGEGGRRIAVLGDMLELGVHSARLHGALAQPLQQSGVDMALLVGDEMKALDAELPEEFRRLHVADAGAARDALTKVAKAGDAIMVKSSNALRLSTLVEALLQSFPGDLEGGEKKLAS